MSQSIILLYAGFTGRRCRTSAAWHPPHIVTGVPQVSATLPVPRQKTGSLLTSRLGPELKQPVYSLSFSSRSKQLSALVDPSFRCVLPVVYLHQSTCLPLNLLKLGRKTMISKSSSRVSKL